MMKQLGLRYLLTLLLILVGKWGYAYTVDELFHNFRKAYESSQNFSADFEETTFRATKPSENDLTLVDVMNLSPDTKSVAKGRLVFGKPDLLRKEYISQKDPDRTVQLIILDGEYSWSYTPMLEQVNKMKWNRSSRKELLPGIGASLEDVEKNYDMKLIPDEVVNKKGIHHIELTPKPHMLPEPVDGVPPPREILGVWIKTDEWLPVQFGYKSESHDGASISVIVSMTHIRRDQELNQDLFNFVVPDGVEVIDLSPDE